MFSHEQLFSAIVAPKGWKSFKKSLKNSANPDLFFSKTILENQYAGCRPCSASFPGWTLRVAEGEKTWICNFNSMRLFWNKKYFSSFQKTLCVTNGKIHWQGHFKWITRELCEFGNRKKNGTGHACTICLGTLGISCELGNRKKWDTTHMQDLPVKTMFGAFWNKLRIRELRKRVARHTGSMYQYLWQGNVLRSLEYSQQHARRCFH